jgi:CDP-diacylglycerol--glycerol-3-phosphate 3-phosphatidyltransferase
MATIVVGRELLVTSLRGMIEGSGGDFSASQLGKWKMVLQCAAVIVILLCLMNDPVAMWASVASQILLWAAILLTLYSGYDYVLAAARALREAPVEA